MITDEDLTTIQAMITVAVNAAIQSHNHLGTDSPEISGSNLVYAPLAKITSIPGTVTGTPSTGGSVSLKAADAAIITSLITQVNLLTVATNLIIKALKTLGFTF